MKKFGGQSVIAGNIIVRQVGSTVHPGTGVGMGRDFTLFALVDGIVKYETSGKGGKTRACVYAA